MPNQKTIKEIINEAKQFFGLQFGSDEDKIKSLETLLQSSLISLLDEVEKTLPSKKDYFENKENDEATFNYNSRHYEFNDCLDKVKAILSDLKKELN